MKRKVAIIDTLGAHGSSFHFYSFGQVLGLSRLNVRVSLYSNNETNNPQIEEVKFHTFFYDLFISKYLVISGLRWIIGMLRSIIHARVNGISIFHFHVFHTNILILFNLLLVKFVMGKVVLTIHDVTSFANDNNSNFISKYIYRLTDVILTHNEFSRDELIKIVPLLKENIHIVPHGNYTPFINIRKDKSKSRAKLDLPQDKTILLFFGMIKKAKGLEVLLKSLRKVASLLPLSSCVDALRLSNSFSPSTKIRSLLVGLTAI